MAAPEMWAQPPPSSLCTLALGLAKAELPAKALSLLLQTWPHHCLRLLPKEGIMGLP